MSKTLDAQIADFKPQIKRLTGQDHLEIQTTNDYRKLAWYAYYIETLEDYRQKLKDQNNYQEKHQTAIDSEIAGIQEDYDDLYSLLSENKNPT